MELMELVKVYGPLSLGWVGFAYMGKFILDRYDKDLESRVQLSNALNALTKAIESSQKEDK